MSNGTYWFGGGIDLTPHYVDKEDAQWFHNRLKAACDKHDEHYYKEFKHWADDYFISSIERKLEELAVSSLIIGQKIKAF